MSAAMKGNGAIANAALSLPPRSRARLADKLLTSLDKPNQRKLDHLWKTEAERRTDAFERGEMKAIPGEKIFRSLKIRKNR
jgi:putative addiction module component (TIGR02574 family)